MGNLNILRSTVGNTSESAPAPVDPMMVGLVRMSDQDLMPAAVRKAQTPTSFEMLPSQPNFGASNCVPSLRPSSGSRKAPREKPPKVEPSLGAIVYRKFAALIEPAPGMFCTTIVGLPGM